MVLEKKNKKIERNFELYPSKKYFQTVSITPPYRNSLRQTCLLTVQRIIKVVGALSATQFVFDADIQYSGDIGVNVSNATPLLSFPISRHCSINNDQNLSKLTLCTGNTVHVCLNPL